MSDTNETMPADRFDLITQRYSQVPYMSEKHARAMRDIVVENDFRDILEIGFFHGKSSLYIAAMLEDLGRGHLVTIDQRSALTRDPTIHQLLEETDLTDRVTPIIAFRSFTWELQKLISQTPRPRFDLCYFDGGHTWDSTGFGVLLVDILLRPGGVLILDDMDWSVKNSGHYRRNPKLGAKFSPDEAATPGVRRTWEVLLPHLGYTSFKELPDLKWGIARKPIQKR